MSEQQVLPERPKIRSDEHYNLVFDAEPADAYMDSLEADSAGLHETIAALRASLAQSEAERERLQGEVAEVIEKNRQFALTCLQMEALVDKACDAGERAEDELTRERERNQALRRVVKEYRNDRESHVICINHNGAPSRYRGEEDDRCTICKKADALLEPQPAPVVTEEK